MKRIIHVRDVVQVMNQIAPPHLALEGDKIGLQVGNLDTPVERVWVALEATPDVVERAIEAGVNLIVTHHALLFRPLAQIDTSRARERAVARLLGAGISVFSAHTNLDVAPGGVNDVIAEKLGLNDVEILDVTYRDKLFKLVVYVPETHADLVRDAVTSVGAGAIGQYSHCTFSTRGIGTFQPNAGATPFIGTVGELEHVDEVRIETVVPEHLLHPVTQATKDAHPYEEVAYDVFSMHQPGTRYGIGRIGNLSRPMPLSEFADTVKSALHMPHIRYAGNPQHEVQRVAVLGGSGSRWTSKSLAKGADVLVTSDVGHHDAGDAWQDGIAVIDATHAALEEPVCDVLAKRLQRHFGGDISIEAAPISVDPFRWL